MNKHSNKRGFNKDNIDKSTFNPISDGVENIRQVAGGVRHHPLLNNRNHCEKPNFFCFSDRSYRNRKIGLK